MKIDMSVFLLFLKIFFYGEDLSERIMENFSIFLKYSNLYTCFLNKPIFFYLFQIFPNINEKEKTERWLNMRFTMGDE